MAPKIIQEVFISGNQAKKEFSEIGLSGQRAFQNIEKAAAKLNVAAPLAQAVQANANLVKGFRSGASTVVEGAQDIDRSTRRATGSVREFGINLRLLGRATGDTQLRLLGRSVSLLGRNLGLLTLPAVVVGMGLLANSAAKVADKIGDDAQAANLSTNAFQTYTDAGIAAGVGSVKMGESVTKLQAALKKTADETLQADERQRLFNQSLGDAKEAAGAAIPNYTKLRDEGIALGIAWGKGAISQEEFDKGQQDIKKGMQETSDAIVKGDEAIRRLTDTHRRATLAAELESTELAKLGIAGRDNAGKLRNVNDVIDELAAKAQGGAIPLDQMQKILNELGLSKNFIPFLNRGAAGIAAMRLESERLAPKLTDVQVATGEKFAASITTLVSVLSNLKDQIGLTFAPTFTTIIQNVTEAFVAARPTIIEFAAAFGSVLLPILQGIGSVITNIIIPAFQALVSALDFIAKKINETFGTNFTGLQLFAAIIVGLVVIFGGTTIAVIALVAAVGSLITQIGGLGVIWTGLGVIWQTVVNGLQTAWSNFVAWFKTTTIGIMIEAIKSAIAWLAKLAAASGSAGGEQFGPPTPEGMASGGLVRGPGTGTSDSILAWLSNREFVAREAAVRKYGLGIFEALNSLRLPKNFLRGFADGGLVSMSSFIMPPLRLAKGGAVSSRQQMRPLSLTIGSDLFEGLLAPETVAQKMIQISTNKQIRSGGRKPTYYGGSR